jgi:hypothetical protein
MKNVLRIFIKICVRYSGLYRFREVAGSSFHETAGSKPLAFRVMQEEYNHMKQNRASESRLRGERRLGLQECLSKDCY